MKRHDSNVGMAEELRMRIRFCAPPVVSVWIPWTMLLDRDHTSISYHLNVASMLGDAQGMVLHPRTAANISQDQNLNRDWVPVALFWTMGGWGDVL